MSCLKFEKMSILSADLGEESSLPPISEKLSLGDISNEFHLEEDDGLFINYGVMECAYPYRYQDMYNRSLTEKEYDTAVLENDFLKAVFIPAFGGKLWSLTDKKTGKELLFRNDVVRPCNLSVRNAWMSGGIEWNCGYKGHHAHTCSPVITSRTSLSDGTPVLRFYYFERIRRAVVQMDFFLPDNLSMLCCRMRITNQNDEVIPMYWWSNVAVTEKDGDRVIVPASMSYTAPNGYVEKISIPVYNGIDISYPASNITSNDYFWKTDKNKRKYICQLDRTGYGLCQTSTSLLKGRKLFVWGDTQGGRKWQNFLTSDDKDGRYNEIQCGLAYTQHECLPMPPHTVWEWMECYGAMTADADKVHGSWEIAQSEAENRLDAIISQENLEKLLSDTRHMATSSAEKVMFFNDGWAALERTRLEKQGGSFLCDHLDFGSYNEEQKDWLNLLDNGTVGVHSSEEIPISYMRQKEWTQLLISAINGKDKDNWYAYYLLGTLEIAEEMYQNAEKHLITSLELCQSAWAYYALAINYKKCADMQKAAENMLKAYSMRGGDVSLAKQVYRCLFEAGMYDKLIPLFEGENDNVKANERCLLYYAYSLTRYGRVDEAEKIICSNGKYLVVPDIRECELTITDLWYEIQEKKGIVNIGEPPYDLDFRMLLNREEWFNNDK